MLRLITSPTVEPVTVTELAANLRLFVATEQQSTYIGYEATFLQSLITAAREDAEHYTGRYWAVQTLEKTLRDFAAEMPLTPSLRSISSVNYLDADEVERAVGPAEYLPLFSSFTGGIEFRSTYSFPSVAERSDAVRVQFEVGPMSVATENGLKPLVPAVVKQAILLIASHWYENREAANVTGSGLEIREVPFAYRWLLDSYRIPVLG